MTRITPEALYALLPAVHRMRDADEGEPLRALLAVLAREGAVIEENIEQLLDDLFVETCDDWAAPYVGGIIGYRPLHPLGGLTAGPRAEVANTIGYRRRKGTAAVLEQLARDVTGWPARVVEYFQLVATCQHMNHVRPDHHWRARPRDPLALEPLGQAFDAVTRTVDVRSITRAPGAQGRRGPPQPAQHRHLPLAPAPHAPRRRPDHPGRRPPPPLRPARRPAPARQPPRGRGDDHQPRPAAQRARRHHPPRAPRRPRPLVRPHRRRPRPRLRDHRRRRADPGRPASRPATCPTTAPAGTTSPTARPRRQRSSASTPSSAASPSPSPRPGEVRTTFHTGFPAPIGGGEYDRAAGLALPHRRAPARRLPAPRPPTLQPALDALPADRRHRRDHHQRRPRRPRRHRRRPRRRDRAPRRRRRPPGPPRRRAARPLRRRRRPHHPRRHGRSKATRSRSPPTPTATRSPR